MYFAKYSIIASVVTLSLQLPTKHDPLRVREAEEVQFLNQKIDSIKAVLGADTSTSVILYCNEGFMAKSGYGCIIFKNGNKLTGEKIYLEKELARSLKINRKILKENTSMLNKLLTFPNTLLEDFPPAKSNYISHDNRIYLYIKIKDKIIYDKSFMRSNTVVSNNNDQIKFITGLSALSHN
jgi:hypothetical protein